MSQQQQPLEHAALASLKKVSEVLEVRINDLATRIERLMNEQEGLKKAQTVLRGEMGKLRSGPPTPGAAE